MRLPSLVANTNTIVCMCGHLTVVRTNFSYYYGLGKCLFSLVQQTTYMVIPSCPLKTKNGLKMCQKQSQRV